MSATKLEKAIAEAERFLEAAKRLKARGDKAVTPNRRFYPSDFSKESGAAKRASMDLTRALAEYRKPGN